MIYSKEINALDIELRSVLNLSKFEIEKNSKVNPSLLQKKGVAFENVVCEYLNKFSDGTRFKNTFEQTSTHAFPDIYSKILEDKWFGIEVKTSQNDWKCFGNSIFESTKIPNLDDRIYVFFGKYGESIECRWSKYEDCIDNINITHSPRFQINMDVNNTSTSSVFKRMNTTYLEFHQKPIHDRMNYIRELKRNELGNNVALWWLPESEEPSIQDEQRLIIKLFSSLSVVKKNEIRNSSLCFFPELYKRRAEYDRVLTWLASNYGVVTSSLRDVYSAGGKHKIYFDNNIESIPRVFFYVENNIEQLLKIIDETSPEILSNFWKISHCPFKLNDKVQIWIKLILESANMDKSILNEWLNRLVFKNI